MAAADAQRIRCKPGRASGRGRLGVFPGLSWLDADGLARGRRSDAQRPAGGDRRDRGFGPEERPAAGRKLRFILDHADGDAVHVGDVGAAQPHRVGGAGLFLLGGISMARRRPDPNRQCCCEQQPELKLPRPNRKHESPRSICWRIVGERREIGKQGASKIDDAIGVRRSADGRFVRPGHQLGAFMKTNCLPWTWPGCCKSMASSSRATQ
jgi:hypothetical protein